MKHIFQFFSLFLLLLSAGCQDNDIMDGQTALKPGEHLISFSVPEPLAATRAMGETPVAASLQNLHVLVFDENGLFLANQVATEVTLTTSTTGQFKVALPQSDVKRILHLVAGNVTYGTYSRKDTEENIMDKLFTTEQEDAYWQRVEVDKIDDSLTTATGTVKLLRNFAKISVKMGTELQSQGNFQILGYAVVNFRDAGTVAPYVGGNSDEFADFTLQDPAVSGKDVYTQFTERNPKFQGNIAGSIKEATPEELENVCTNEPKYIYEQRQVNNQNPAYVMVKASYMGQTCYYKLDIVRTDANYITSYLNIYRNFHYIIQINKVAGMGSTDIESAMKSTASNNLSASVEVSEVNSIEDGIGNKLEVQTIDTMLVNNTAVQLRVSYTEQNTPAPGKVIVTPVPQLNTAALKAVSYDSQKGIITVTPADNLPPTLQTQELVVSTPSGLSRRISVKVRQPYVFDLVDCQEKVEQKINAPLGVGIRLPMNMPAAVFPLTILIEPEKKSIYPNASMNTLPVKDGKKSFSYAVEINYNDYRQSRSFYLHFKSNIAASATSIAVTNPYFENKNNTCAFTNTTTPIDKFPVVNFGVRAPLQDVLNDKLYDEIPFGMGQEVWLEFDLKPGHQSMVGIQPGDFLEFVSSSTGSAVEHESNGGLAYRPNDPTARQVLKFKTTAKYVGGNMQLYSMDYEMAEFTYRNIPVRLQLKYKNNYTGDVISNGTVQLYGNANYTGTPVEFTTDSNGYITLLSFANREDGDKVYFQYSRRFTTYRGEITISEIVNGGAGNNTLILTN